ncbi:response regulator [Thermodesulfobacteriota bacterium]
MNIMQETINRNVDLGYPPPHVLLVEDEPNMAKGLKMVMNEGGYNVDLARTGQAALNAFGEDDFDLLVADLRLPDIDGMEVIERVKGIHPDIKVIIITGFPSVSSAVKAVKMGVSDFLRKPFTSDEFLAAVSDAMKVKKPSIEELITETEKERLIQKQEVLRVLDRASQDTDFWTDIYENNSNALKDYQLSSSAKAAIISGDLHWIRENVGELTKEQLQLIMSRLEREVW